MPPGAVARRYRAPPAPDRRPESAQPLGPMAGLRGGLPLLIRLPRTTFAHLCALRGAGSLTPHGRALANTLMMPAPLPALPHPPAASAARLAPTPRPLPRPVRPSGMALASTQEAVGGVPDSGGALGRRRLHAAAAGAAAEETAPLLAGPPQQPSSGDYGMPLPPGGKRCANVCRLAERRLRAGGLRLRRSRAKRVSCGGRGVDLLFNLVPAVQHDPHRRHGAALPLPLRVFRGPPPAQRCRQVAHAVEALRCAAATCTGHCHQRLAHVTPMQEKIPRYCLDSLTRCSTCWSWRRRPRTLLSCWTLAEKRSGGRWHLQQRCAC